MKGLSGKIWICLKMLRLITAVSPTPENEHNLTKLLHISTINSRHPQPQPFRSPVAPFPSRNPPKSNAFSATLASDSRGTLQSEKESEKASGKRGESERNRVSKDTHDVDFGMREKLGAQRRWGKIAKVKRTSFAGARRLAYLRAISRGSVSGWLAIG